MKDHIEELKEEKKIDELMEILQEGETAEREDAAKALGMLNLDDLDEDVDGKIVPALVERVEKDEEATVRANAVLALGHQGSEIAKEALEEASEDDHWEVRHDAAIAMGEYQESYFKEILYSLLEDEEREIQRKAIDSLGKIGRKEEDEEIISKLEGYLDEPELKKEAVEAIGKIGTDKALDPLIQVFAESDREIREIAISRLGEMEGERVEEVLKKALEDDSWRVREEAAKLLGKREHDEEVVGSLLKRSEDENSHVVEEALKSLGSLGIEGEKELEKIEEKLQNQDPAIRIASAEALERIDTEDSCQFLVEALRTEDNPRVLWSTSDSLAEISKNHLKEFTDKLERIGRSKRIFADAAMGKAGFSSYAEELNSMLEDDRWKVRQKAAEAFRGIDGEELNKKTARSALRKLSERLEDNDKWVRAESARTLGDMVYDLEGKVETEKAEEKILKRAEVEGDPDVQEALDYAKNLLDI
ncbi:MAG: HEAT repeat domain-containing protein [Candidatus Thermoplasmatota archaeon]|nr:HEAT repeat domain-containing protein [Candidatus Thermoplasmatota archaeon]